VSVSETENVAPNTIHSGSLFPLVTYPHPLIPCVVDADEPLDEVEIALSKLETGVQKQRAQASEDLIQLEESIEETAIKKLQEQLSELETGIAKIPSPEPPPQTTLQIQNQSDVEAAWQNYLKYFVNPDANHGLGTDAIVEFLRGLDSETNEKVPTRVSDDVEVDDEVGSPNGNIPDIVIQDPGEFFVCCELKLYSSEGENQTQNYYDDDYIGKTLKSQFPEGGRHYVYVKRPDSPKADCSEFVNITWKQVQEWFEPLLLNNQGRYSSRTAAQLSDFIDTIQQDMTQDEHIQTAQKKMELYFNHQDAIKEAKRGVEIAYEYEKENWRRRFIEGYLPENWSEDWHTEPSKYGHIYHSKWRQDGGLAKENTKIRLHFVHLIRNQSSFEDGELTFQLRMPNGGDYRDQFKELFVSDRFSDQLDLTLGEHDINKKADYSLNNPRFTEKVYSVDRTDLPESYYEVLQQAAREHIQVAPEINEILDTAIEEVENEI